MEKKGWRVNAGKTRLMICGTGLDLLQSSGEFSCAVCHSGVGSNSIFCNGCKHWVHKWAQALAKGPWLQMYTVPGNCTPLGWQTTEGSPGPDKLEVVASFCYLGDMLSAAGGCELSTTTRVKTTWKKFKDPHATSLSKHVAVCTALVCGAQCSMPVRLGHWQSWTSSICNEMTGQWSNRSAMSGHKTLSPPGPVSYLCGLALRIWTSFWRREDSNGMDMWNAPMVHSRQPGWWKAWASGRPKMTWKQLAERDCRELKLSAINLHACSKPAICQATRHCHQQVQWATCAAWHWGSGSHSEGEKTPVVWTCGTLQWCTQDSLWHTGWWKAWASGRPKMIWKQLAERDCREWKLSAINLHACSKPAIWKGAHWCGCCPCTCMLIKNLIMIYNMTCYLEKCTLLKVIKVIKVKITRFNFNPWSLNHNCSRWHFFFFFFFFFFFIFYRKSALIFHVNHLLGRQLTWNVKTYFLRKIKKRIKMLSATNFAWRFMV